jgi:hypothetical protein
MRTAGITVTFFLLVAMIIAGWLSAAWSADVTPAPPPPVESRPEPPQGPSTPPTTRIDTRIEPRPRTIPYTRTALTPPNVDPKMTIDPETAPPATEKTKPGGSNDPPSKPSPR